MSVSVSVGLGTSPPLGAVLVPSILEGTTLPGPVGAPAAAELSDELMAAAPWGTAPSPAPLSLSQRWQRQPGRGGQAPTPPAPVCGQAWPLLPGHGGTVAARVCPQLLSVVPTQESCEVHQAPGPSALLSCLLFGLAPPFMATRICRALGGHWMPTVCPVFPWRCHH